MIYESRNGINMIPRIHQADFTNLGHRLYRQRLAKHLQDWHLRGKHALKNDTLVLQDSCQLRGIDVLNRLMVRDRKVCRHPCSLAHHHILGLHAERSVSNVAGGDADRYQQVLKLLALGDKNAIWAIRSPS